MRRLLEGPVRRWWGGEGGALGLVLAPVALPLSLLYGVGVRMRGGLYDHGLRRIEQGVVPVVSIGNLVVGGTGKTPVSRWILGRIEGLGVKPALVLRGYGDDETLLHRRWNPHLAVVASADRPAAVREAADSGAGVVVLDDGFQHRRLARDLDIVLVAAEDPIPARLLPRGPYREPLRALRRADLVLVTSKSEATRERAGELSRRLGRRRGFPPAIPLPLGAGGWQSLAGAPAGEPQGEVLVVASVARPESVVELAREAGIRTAGLLAFPDHHRFSDADVERIRVQAGGRGVITTEKDAVKLERWSEALPDVRVLTLEVRAGPGVQRIVEKELERVVAGEREP
jgi:tetraacyldisaccharide 4'-kinase